MNRPNPKHNRRPRGAAMMRLKMAVRVAASMVKRTRRKTRSGRRFTTDLELARHWERIATILLRFGGATASNNIRVFCDGDQLLEDLWLAIDAAKNTVWLEMYTIAPDRVGLRTMQALTQAAQRGCNVLLLYDAIGSSGVTESMLNPLRETGAQIQVFNPVLKWRRRQPLLRRDHRKIAVIDGQIGFCGGMNLTEDYAGKKHGNETFRDCHVRVDGPCVRDLAAVTASSWFQATRERLSLRPAAKPCGPTLVQVLASSGWQGRRAIQRALRLSVRGAANQCFIATPYFVPPMRLTKAINRAAQRGVDVRILTAGRSDVPIVSVASRHIYGSLLKCGVRIYEMQGRTLHAKTICIDGLHSTVGSFNLDTWSDKRNLEVNVAMLDATVSAELREQFMADLKTSTEVTLETWKKRSIWQRILHWAAYQMLRL